jgi:hypothetical protein
VAAGRTSARLSTVDVAATKRSDRDSPSDRQCIFSAFGKARQAAEAARHSGQGVGSSRTLGGRIVRVMRGFRPCTWMRGNVLMLFVPPSGNHLSQQPWHSLPGIGNGDARRAAARQTLQKYQVSSFPSFLLEHASQRTGPPRLCAPPLRDLCKADLRIRQPTFDFCRHGGHGREGVLRVDNSQFMSECLHRPHLKCPWMT